MGTLRKYISVVFTPTPRLFFPPHYPLALILLIRKLYYPEKYQPRLIPPPAVIFIHAVFTPKIFAGKLSLN
jgi:hypothetical protein